MLDRILPRISLAIAAADPVRRWASSPVRAVFNKASSAAQLPESISALAYILGKCIDQTK